MKSFCQLLLLGSLCLLSLHAHTQALYAAPGAGQTTAWSSFENPTGSKGAGAATNKGAKGRATGGTIGQLVLAERFRWLTATRSTVVQCSPVHPGRCTEAAETLERLLGHLVR